MKHKNKIDVYGKRMNFIIQRINEINEWRNEAVLHAANQEQKDKIDAEVLRLRELAESSK